MRDDYRNEQDFYRQRLMPFLGQNASLPQINMAIEHIPGRPDQPYIFPELVISEPRDHSALLSNLEFQGLLAESIELFPHILRPGYPTIDAQLDKVISMLEEELAR